MLDRRPAVTTTMAVAGLDPAGDDGVAALDDALETGFVELVERPGERSLGFTHPLVAAAVSGDMSPSRRAELHRAAGAVRPAWPACATASTAARATTPAWPQTPAPRAGRGGRGAYASAARLWADVARVDPDPGGRDQARLQAVDHHLLAGDLAAAARDRPLVDDAADGPLRSFVLGRLAYVLGPRREAEGHLDSAWHQVDVADDRALAGRIAALRATTAVDRGDGATGLVWARGRCRWPGSRRPTATTATCWRCRAPSRARRRGHRRADRGARTAAARPGRRRGSAPRAGRAAPVGARPAGRRRRPRGLPGVVGRRRDVRGARDGPVLPRRAALASRPVGRCRGHGRDRGGDRRRDGPGVAGGVPARGRRLRARRPRRGRASSRPPRGGAGGGGGGRRRCVPAVGGRGGRPAGRVAVRPRRGRRHRRPTRRRR